MAPARGALLGALLLASAAALQPVGDAVGDEAPALEKEEWPRRRARKEARQRLDQMPFEDLRGFGRVMEMDDDLQLRDGPPPAAGCYMRMSSGCPKQPMRTQAWRRDKLASDRGLDDEGCRRRKEVWDRYCGSEDAEMLYVGGQASSKTISTLQVDAVWWPWGKKHESTKLDEEAPAVPAGKPDRTEDESKNDEENEGEEKQNRIINGYPSRPGCYFRQPSKCPAKPQFTSMWRHDTWAEENGLDEAGCKDRKGYWDRYCESNDTKIVHIGADLGIINETSSQETQAAVATEQEPGASAQKIIAQDASDAFVGTPTSPGCYMRMSSGCPGKPMETHAWRLDSWAEAHDLDQADCEARKYVWDRYCETDDAKVLFVPKSPSQ